MTERTRAILVTIAFSLVGALGDFMLKLASGRPHPFRSPWFFGGLAVYATTAFAWTYVMARLKLGTLTLLYSLSMVLLLTSLGIVAFHERPNRAEVLGLVLAVCALALLARFGA